MAHSCEAYTHNRAPKKIQTSPWYYLLYTVANFLLIFAKHFFATVETSSKDDFYFFLTFLMPRDRNPFFLETGSRSFPTFYRDDSTQANSPLCSYFGRYRTADGNFFVGLRTFFSFRFALIDRFHSYTAKDQQANDHQWQYRTGFGHFFSFYRNNPTRWFSTCRNFTSF